MSDRVSDISETAPWLTIIGLGEDGVEGLTSSARRALDAAEIIMAPPRHLALVEAVVTGGGEERKPRMIAWPVPFAEGVTQLLELRGARVVVLASGDPFWFGAGSVLAEKLHPGEWTAHPGASVFSLAAARLGWRLEQTTCLGLHAAPFARLRPHLAPGKRLVATLREGEAASELATYLTDIGFGDTLLHVLEALGGPRERLRAVKASAYDLDGVAHPVCVALEPQGPAIPLASGRPDDLFENDGQITKRPVRALTLSALAPRPGEHLWDIGGGSGSISIEWLMAEPSMRATIIEQNPTRAERIAANAARLGQDRLSIVTGKAPEALTGLDRPDAVFIGGGLSEALLDWLSNNLKGTRLVANAVTLESQALLTQSQVRHGGDLLRIEIAQTAAIGPKRGWKAAYPIVQWSVTL